MRVQCAPGRGEGDASGVGYWFDIDVVVVSDGAMRARYASETRSPSATHRRRASPEAVQARWGHRDMAPYLHLAVLNYPRRQQYRRLSTPVRRRWAALSRRCSKSSCERIGVRGWLADGGCRLVEVVDDLDQLGARVAALACEDDELAGAGGDSAAVWCSGDCDAAPAPEVEQSFVSERAQRPQHCVGVDADHRGQVLGRWQALAWFGLAFGDRAADFGGDLLVQVGWVAVIDLDRERDANYPSFIVRFDQPGS